jgi:hypothetical protein
LCDDTAVASNSRELANSSQISPEDEPSVEWGWHGGFPKGTIIGGVITIIACIAFIPGPYQSKTQYIWLILIALAVLAGIVGHVIRQRNSWRR